MAKARRGGSVKEPSQLGSNSNSKTGTPKTQLTKISSLQLKTVLLYDWWLFKAEEGKGLAVAGFASRESLGVRAFCSTAIAKRHDATTVETVDGITITISGLINRSRTHLNGFPVEVCNHFLLGFPYYWEEYANQCCSQRHDDGGVASRISSSFEVNMSPGSCTNTIQLVSLDDIPVTRICDLLFSPRRDSDNGALERKTSNVNRKSGCGIDPDETLSNPKKAKDDQQYRDHEDLSDASIPSRGVVTRSMARLKTLASKQEENLVSKSPPRYENGARILTSEATGIQSRATVTRSNSKERRANTTYQGNSSVRRSSRLKNTKKSI